MLRALTETPSALPWRLRWRVERPGQPAQRQSHSRPLLETKAACCCVCWGLLSMALLLLCALEEVERRVLVRERQRVQLQPLPCPQLPPHHAPPGTWAGLTWSGTPVGSNAPQRLQAARLRKAARAL